MKKIPLTAIVIAKNEEKYLPGCLSCLRFCREVLVIDSGSSDKTAEIAENFGAQVISFHHRSFAKLRTEGLKHVNNQWVFYVDADERVSPVLAREIGQYVLENTQVVLKLKRDNIFYGQLMRFGGWQNDYIERVFPITCLESWQGSIHETPIYQGKSITLSAPLWHFSHRFIADGLTKSAYWTPMEAELLYASSIKKVGFLQIMRKGVLEFVRRAILKKGFKDGQAGLVEALIQAINRMLVYIQVWELQRVPKIKDAYSVKEREIELLWEKDNQNLNQNTSL